MTQREAIERLFNQYSSLSKEAVIIAAQKVSSDIGRAEAGEFELSRKMGGKSSVKTGVTIRDLTEIKGLPGTPCNRLFAACCQAYRCEQLIFGPAYGFKMESIIVNADSLNVALLEKKVKDPFVEATA